MIYDVLLSVFIILIMILFIIICRVYKNIFEISSCRECDCFKKDNYCIFLKKKIEDSSKLNCNKEKQ